MSDTHSQTTTPEFDMFPKFELLINLLLGTVAPCGGGPCYGPAISVSPTPQSILCGTGDECLCRAPIRKNAQQRCGDRVDRNMPVPTSVQAALSACVDDGAPHTRKCPPLTCVRRPNSKSCASIPLLPRGLTGVIRLAILDWLHPSSLAILGLFMRRNETRFELHSIRKDSLERKA